jgi:hypothetical protein
MDLGSNRVARGRPVSKLIGKGTLRTTRNFLLGIIHPKEVFMNKIRFAVAALIIAGLASPISTVQAMTHKHHKSTTTTGSNMKSGTTTGANTKPSSANPSSQGNTGAGTNHPGSATKND